MKKQLRSCSVFVLVALATMLGLPSVVRAQTDYKIGPQDVLSISVLGEPDLTNKFTVEQDGTFTFPYIGRVKAAGLTLREFEQELIKALSPEYLKNPQVTVAFETYRSQKILVLGEVRSPGIYLLNGDTTLLAALAQAGYTTPTAGHEALIVRPTRQAEGTPSTESDVIKVNLTALMQGGNPALNISLADGDTVNVPKAQMVTVYGFVKAPGAYPVEPNETVQQVLALAGGLGDRGASSRIKIQRTVKGKATEIKAKLTDIVQPGDTIVVPERFF